jgi:hypothetical protein
VPVPSRWDARRTGRPPEGDGRHRGEVKNLSTLGLLTIPDLGRPPIDPKTPASRHHGLPGGARDPAPLTLEGWRAGRPAGPGEARGPRGPRAAAVGHAPPVNSITRGWRSSRAASTGVDLAGPRSASESDRSRGSGVEGGRGDARPGGNGRSSSVNRPRTARRLGPGLDAESRQRHSSP